MLLGYGYVINNFVHLVGFPTYRDVADMSYFFYFYFVFTYNQGEWRTYRDLAFRSEMRWTKIDINTSANLSRQKLCECVCTNCMYNFYHVVLSMSSLARWNRLYLNTKIYYQLVEVQISLQQKQTNSNDACAVCYV